MENHVKNASVWQLLLLFLSMSLPPQVTAGPTLSLGDMCRMADRSAEVILSAKDDCGIAIEDRKRALANLLPWIQTSGQQVSYRNNDAYSPNTRTLGINIGQSYTLNGREFTYLAMAGKKVELTGYALESVRSDFLYNVANGFVSILKAKQREQIALAEINRLKIHLSHVQEQLAAGDVTRTDLHRAIAELAKARTSQVSAHTEKAQNRADLVRMTGVDRTFSLDERGLADINRKGFDPEEIKADALKSRADIRQAKKALAIALDQIDYEKGNFWPALSVETGYRETDISYSLTAGRNYSYDKEEAYICADLSFNIYAGGYHRAARQKALLEHKKARQDLQVLEKQVIYEAEAAFLNFTAKKAILVNLEQELTAARENFNAVEEQFRFGMKDSMDIMDANTLLVQAEQNMADAGYDLSLSVLAILYAKGRLTPCLLALP